MKTIEKEGKEMTEQVKKDILRKSDLKGNTSTCPLKLNKCKYADKEGDKLDICTNCYIETLVDEGV